MNIIPKLVDVLNILKDFRAYYSTTSMGKGLMMFDYKDRRYAVKIVEITDPNREAVKDIDNLEYIKF